MNDDSLLEPSTLYLAVGAILFLAAVTILLTSSHCRQVWGWGNLSGTSLVWPQVGDCANTPVLAVSLPELGTPEMEAASGGSRAT